MTVQKTKCKNKNAMVEVWKNLVILYASDEKEAISKALKIGASEAGDSRGSLRLNGKPAITKFLGIEDMGLLFDGVEDGAEILWQLKRCRQKTALTWSMSKKTYLQS